MRRDGIEPQPLREQGPGSLATLPGPWRNPRSFPEGRESQRGTALLRLLSKTPTIAFVDVQHSNWRRWRLGFGTRVKSGPCWII